MTDSIPIDRQLQTHLLAEATLYRQSLYNTAKYLLGYKEITWDTHGPMIEALESVKKRKLIVTPRGAFKSSLGVVAYCVWTLIRDPNARILIDSELYTNSKNFLHEIKQHLESEKLTKLFGTFKSKKRWNESEIVITQRTKKLKEASITCGGVGTTKVGQHYTCLLPKTQVFTSNGYVPIKDIRKAHRVYGSDGKFHSVLAVSKKKISKQVIGIRPRYHFETNWMTEDHRVLVHRDYGIEWIEAGNIRPTDFLCIPKIKGKTRAVSRVDPWVDQILTEPDIWRFIGYWLAEGCRTTDGYGIRLTFGDHEDDLINDCVSIVEKYLLVKPAVHQTKSSTKLIYFSHQRFKNILAKFGSRASDKHIPPFALNAHDHLRAELVKGYFLGDGCLFGQHISFTSISRDLVTGIQLMLATWDIPSTMTFGNGGQKIVVGNLCNTQDYYSIRSTHYKLHLLLNGNLIWPIKPIRSFFTKDFWVIPIRSIQSKSYDGLVYDIQVADTEDFYIPGMIVHNCLIHDDLNSGANSATPEARQKVITHFRMNLAILEPEGELVVIGTRYATDDIIGWIIENEIGYSETAKGLL